MEREQRMSSRKATSSRAYTGVAATCFRLLLHFDFKHLKPIVLWHTYSYCPQCLEGLFLSYVFCGPFEPFGLLIIRTDPKLLQCKRHRKAYGNCGGAREARLKRSLPFLVAISIGSKPKKNWFPSLLSYKDTICIVKSVFTVTGHHPR